MLLIAAIVCPLFCFKKARAESGVFLPNFQNRNERLKDSY